MGRIQYDKALERIDNPEPDTDERQQAADVIEDMWPAHVNDIADATEFSHGHIRNVLESHYRYVDPDRPEEPIKDREITITVPKGVSDPLDYAEGWINAHRDTAE